MKRIERSLLISLIALPASAQTRFHASSNVKGWPTIRLESELEPAAPPMATDFISGVTGGQRFLYDKQKHVYFGYGVVLEKLDPIDTRITLEPLSAHPAEIPIADSLARRMPSPPFPGPQVVRFGDEVAIKFFENPKTGQAIVDYLWLEPRSCDGDREGSDCLNTLLAVATADLQRVIQDKISAIVQQRIQEKMQGVEDKIEQRIDEKLQKWQERHEKRRALEQSQKSWEIYRDQMCAGLPEGSARLDCKLKLTSSRIHDVERFY